MKRKYFQSLSLCSESESQREVPQSDSEEEEATVTPTVTGDELAEEPTAGICPDWKYISIYLSGDQDERRRPEILQEEEEPVTSGDNDLHDIPDNLLTKLLAIEMETLDTEKERINVRETEPETQGEIFSVRKKF